MKLKQLHEKALWSKLNEKDFKTKAINIIISQEESIDKLNTITNQLTEDLHKIKQQLSIASAQNARLNKQARITQKASDDNTQAKQERNS